MLGPTTICDVNLFTLGYYDAQLTVVLADLVGMEHVASGLGVLSITGASGFLVGTPLGGKQKVAFSFQFNECSELLCKMELFQ